MKGGKTDRGLELCSPIREEKKSPVSVNGKLSNCHRGPRKLACMGGGIHQDDKKDRS